MQQTFLVGKLVKIQSFVGLFTCKFVFIPTNYDKSTFFSTNSCGIITHMGLRTIQKRKPWDSLLTSSKYYLKTIQHETKNFYIVDDIVIHWFKKDFTISSVSDITILEQLTLLTKEK